MKEYPFKCFLLCQRWKNYFVFGLVTENDKMVGIQPLRGENGKLKNDGPLIHESKSIVESWGFQPTMSEDEAFNHWQSECSKLNELNKIGL